MQVLKFKDDEQKELSYVLSYPKGYTAGTKKPVIIFIHGAGSRGSNIDLIKNHVYFQETSKHENYDFITVAPQCPGGQKWIDNHLDWLQDFATFISQEDYADPSRIYLVGVSMGGHATWYLSARLPQMFAAIVPICGKGNVADAEKLLNMPIWAFHGAKDTTVPPSGSEDMIAAIRELGGTNAKLTIYPNATHDSWTETFKNPAVFDWLLGHTNAG